MTRLALQDTSVRDRSSFATWLGDHGYSQWAAYQPDSRFWHFQTVEATGYLLLALLLAAATLLWIRHRAS